MALAAVATALAAVAAGPSPVPRPPLTVAPEVAAPAGIPGVRYAPAMATLSVEALAARLGDPDLRVVDVRWYLGQPGRGREAYEAGHIPGALYLDVDEDLTSDDGPGRHPLPDPDTFVRRLERAGIGSSHLVVAYDDVGGWVAARLWWMLDDLGHDRVAVLDGGFPSWRAAGLPITTDVPAWPPVPLQARSRWTGILDRDELRSRLGSVAVLDARAAPRYRGEVEPIDPVAGHIPTAVSAPTDGNLRPDGRFLPPHELAARYRALGVDGRQAVTYCGSGVSACHHALAMRLAGLPRPLLYPGSWSDWSRAGYPVATGPEPGEPPVP